MSCRYQEWTRHPSSQRSIYRPRIHGNIFCVVTVVSFCMLLIMNKRHSYRRWTMHQWHITQEVKVN